MRIIATILLVGMLAGCASSQATSVAGACAAFRPAPHPIRAETRTGQAWVSGTIEAQHRVCGFPRPARAGGER